MEENLELFRGMRDGKFPDGAHVLRAKIDMRSPNLNLRDPVIYRIRHATHHRTGDKWCIYPMYDYAHGLSDCDRAHHALALHARVRGPPAALRLVQRAARRGRAAPGPLPQQIEFARLNLTYVVLCASGRLIQLVEDGHVDGWDDPRMPTLVGARRRGYTPEGFRLFAERIGVSKAHPVIDFASSRSACAST